VHPRDIHSIASDIGEGPVAVGANCGVGASDILSSLLDMTAADPEAIVVVKGNCGIPEFKGTEIHYSGTPPLMADYARLAWMPARASSAAAAAPPVTTCAPCVKPSIATSRHSARRWNHRRPHRPDAQHGRHRQPGPHP
jgi:5-methyltetrahydrofolate--homocysteine methyltransferase